MGIPICPKCWKEASQETNYCPYCGTPLNRNITLLQEKIAELRHQETEATVAAVVGFITFMAGLIVRVPSYSPYQPSSSFLNLLLLGIGFIILISMSFLSQYYSSKRKKLLKKLE
jgi:uncharacterized membrane protein YvbJ